MAWTCGYYGLYECIGLMSETFITPTTVVKADEYYVYAFTVSKQKTVNVQLIAPGGGYRRPAGQYIIGTGDVPEPDSEMDTGYPPTDRWWRNAIVTQVDTIEFNAMPGTLYWIWMRPQSAGPGNYYAVKFDITTSDRYAEPVFDVSNVGPDGLGVKVMDAYGMVNGLCQIFIDGVYQGDLTVRTSSNWQEWGISNLNAGTYSVTVTYRKNDYTWGDMRYYFGRTSSSAYTATVTIQGAGSIGNAYFTAIGDGDTNTISIDVHNANSITPSVDHYIYSIMEKSEAFPTNDESTYVNHDFTDLFDGEWRVTVSAVLTSGRVIPIPTQARGSIYAITITFGGSGGGGGGEEENTWNIVSENLGSIDSSYVNFCYYDKYTLYQYRASFEYSGYVTFYSGTGTTVDLADPVGWITEYASTYNSDLGQPPPSALVPGKYVTDDDSGGSSQFTMSFYVTAGTEYCFWFKLKNGANTGYTYVGIEPPSGSTTAWKYNMSYLDIRNISDTQNKNVSLQSYEGAMFKVTFASAGIARFSVSISGQTANVYVTTGQYSWATDGIPLTKSGTKAAEVSNTPYPVLSETEYYVWVKGSTTSTRGTATVIITFTQSWNYEYDSSLNIRNISSTQTRRTRVSRYTGSCFLITFAVAGTATISVSGGNAYIVYATDGYHQWDPEDGSPYKDDAKRKAVGGESVTISVTTSDSYYIWVRGSTASTTGYNITVTISIQTVTTSGFWVVVNRGTQQNPNYDFVKTTVWLFTSGAFRKITPCVYASSVWVEGS